MAKLTALVVTAVMVPLSVVVIAWGWVASHEEQRIYDEDRLAS